MNGQEMRKTSAETDSLYYAIGWEMEDLDKPQIMIASTYGDSHPGSSHLNVLAEQAEHGVYEAGGAPAKYYVTDICDGVCQGSVGMRYSLLSRDIIAIMIEIQSITKPLDAAVFISSCDKSVPAHLLASARIAAPSVIVPGGAMIQGAASLSCDQMWEYERQMNAGKISSCDYRNYQKVACPSEGACQGMGTASTMQVIAEALGLTLPNAALLPVSNSEIRRKAKEAGKCAVNLAKRNIKMKDIVSKESILNAIVVHSAICGSANAILHLTAFAQEMGYDLPLETFDEIHKKIPVLTDVQPVGKYPTEWFWYAGGTLQVMSYLKPFLNLDVLTVTGESLGDRITYFEESKERTVRRMFLNNFNANAEAIIRTPENPFAREGGMAVLKGNICKGGALIKHAAVVKEMCHHKGTAKVYTNENDAICDLLNNKIQPGTFIVIKYQGPKASGMPEMFRISDALAKRPELVSTTAIITDGRYSGYTKGPAIGYVTPEAYQGGEIALIEDGDILELDIDNRSLNLIGIKGNIASSEQIAEEFKNRRQKWSPPEIPVKNGGLSVYRKLIDNPLLGSRLI